LSTPGNSVPVGNTNSAPTVEQFLADYPKFDTSEETDEGAVQFGLEALQYWLNLAVLMLNQSRFGSLYYTAVELFMAHNLALEAWSEQGGDQTIPGLSKGMLTGTTSGDVTVSYDNVSVLELDAGHWNNTTYGTRFIKLCRLVSAGPLQVTGGGCGGAGAWAGIPIFNYPNPSGF
jgi:Protein of unknown function (DUF4054)